MRRRGKKGPVHDDRISALVLQPRAVFYSGVRSDHLQIVRIIPHSTAVVDCILCGSTEGALRVLFMHCRPFLEPEALLPTSYNTLQRTSSAERRLEPRDLGICLASAPRGAENSVVVEIKNIAAILVAGLRKLWSIPFQCFLL